MTLPALAQGLHVFERTIGISNAVTRTFDLEKPAVVREAIVGVNYKVYGGWNEIGIWEVDSTSPDPLQEYVHFRDTVLWTEGRGVIRSVDRQGYLIVGVGVASPTDTLLFVARADTTNWQSGGTILWAQHLHLMDTVGGLYEVSVPTEVVLFDSVQGLYLICGYVRRGNEQGAFLLQIDDQGVVRWVQVYWDEATKDHLASPLWCWDMDYRAGKEVVLCGSRVTEFVRPVPPSNCENERQQGWLLVVDGYSGMPLGDIVYASEERCSEFRQVEVVESRNRIDVVAVGWGNTEMVTGATVTYAGDLGNVLGGKVLWHSQLSQQVVMDVLENRLYDLEVRVVADTIDEMMGMVGSYRDSNDTGQWMWIGKYRNGGYDKAQYRVFEMDGMDYNEWNNWPQLVDEEVRWMESSGGGEALYLAGWRQDEAVVRRVEWRLSKKGTGVWGGGACHAIPGFATPMDDRGMYVDRFRWAPALVIPKRVDVEVRPMGLISQPCQDRWLD